MTQPTGAPVGIRDVVLKALWDTPDCPDTAEVNRACRYCEADAVSLAVVQHLLGVMDEEPPVT